MNEEEGVKAIIFLQKIVGIDEPEERARTNWNTFTQSEKETTMMAYARLRTIWQSHVRSKKREQDE